MRIEYTVTRDDMWRARRQMMASVPALRIVFVIGLPLFWIAMLAFLLGQSHRPPVAMIIWAVATGVALLAFALGFPDRFQQLPNGGKGVLGTHQMIVTPDGLEESTEFNRDFRPWKAISRITKTPAYIFIVTETSAAYIIPAKSLSQGTPEAFFDAARTYWLGVSGTQVSRTSLLKTDQAAREKRLERWAPLLFAALVGMIIVLLTLPPLGKAGSGLGLPGRALARALWNHPAYGSPDFVKASATMCVTNLVVWGSATYALVQAVSAALARRNGPN